MLRCPPVVRRVLALVAFVGAAPSVGGCYPCDAEQACRGAEPGEVVFVSEECVLRCGVPPDGGVADGGVADGGDG